jgi:uncharacterized membrane protein YfcA
MASAVEETPIINRRAAQYAPKMQPSGGKGYVMDSINNSIYHLKAGNMNWPMVIYMTFVHVTAVIGFFSAFHVSWKTLLWAYILWPISGFGITAGVHRLWAHRSYDAHWTVRCALMLMNSIANQVCATFSSSSSVFYLPDDFLSLLFPPLYLSIPFSLLKSLACSFKCGRV